MESKQKSTKENHSQESTSKKSSPAEKSILIKAPSITLSKGGGAIKSIDEKFQVNPVNGTASLAIPLPITEGRNEFNPSLSLSYNSGVGNSCFGIGWNVDVPSIQRKTDKKLPEYRDGLESDVFVISGAEDLTPKLVRNDITDMWDEQIETRGNYIIKQYAPRVEGAFSRIEKIQPVNATYFYWKVTTRENTVTFFGKTAAYRIVAPDGSGRIFKWLPEISFDDKGNIMQYEFKDEDTALVLPTLNEGNRLNGTATFSNKHIKRIRYANKNPFYPPYIQNIADLEAVYNTALPIGLTFLMEVVFDYGEHTDDKVTEAVLWPARIDAFSDYRAGFEMRTYRLCKRVMMFHRFAELGLQPCLVKSLDLTYRSSSATTPQKTQLTYLVAIKQVSYKQKTGGGYDKAELPAIDLEYQELHWDTEVKTISHESLVNSPTGLSANYQWMDFYGEGISGIFAEQGEGWYYKSNLGKDRDDESGRPNFSRATKISPRPNLSGLGNGTLQLVDLEANGKKQVVIHSKELKGFFELQDDGGWSPFRSFRNTHNIDLRDPNVKLVDINGDGRPDIVISEDHVFQIWISDGKNGHRSFTQFPKTTDDERGPAVVFADSKQTIYTADMSGDGLTDIVRIRNGEICYWPNLGYGKFGRKVNMENPPLFDTPDQFNPAYINLSDISGTGATDIVYLGKNKFRAWLNLSGNGWSDVQEIAPFPTTQQPNVISVVDLLGTGTSCIVWSSPLQRYANSPMQYIDLMGGKKPHILKSYKNNLGKETHWEYKSSSYYYLKDKQAGTPWITKLPFPVQCVSSVILLEKINNTRYTNEYIYHHGYYDYAEREFRGFGMVEQTDTEAFEKWVRQNASTLYDERLFQHPVKTKTWFHTGVFLNRETVLKLFQDDYYANSSFAEYHLPDADVDNVLTGEKLSADEYRQAVRACKGMMLRKEVYALDGSTKEHLPYTVEEQNCSIKILQPQNDNRYAVFLTTPKEKISYQYERNDADPRINHSLATKIDQYGNTLEQATIAYRRQISDSALPQRVQDEQDVMHITLTENFYTNDVIDDVARPEAYRLRSLAETITYHLTGVNKAIGSFFSAIEIHTAFLAAIEIPYHIPPPPLGVRKRKIDHVRHLFNKDDLSGPLALYQQASLGLVYETYKLAFSAQLLADVFVRNGTSLVTEAELTRGRYLKDLHYKAASVFPLTASLFPETDPDDDWWLRSGTHGYPANPADHFYTPDQYFDPFGNSTRITYDANYKIHVIETEDATGSKTAVVAYNYRVMQPESVKDVNDNYSDIQFDITGFVVGAAIRGKGNEADDFSGFKADLTQTEIDNFFLNPTVHAGNLLQHASSRFVYDLHRYRISGGMLPAVVGTITRETHFNFPGGNTSKLQLSFEYTDGNGQVLMKKAQAEPGVAKQLVFESGAYAVKEVDTLSGLRWIGNGRTIMNNKGKTIKQYEPYFSITHHYESARELVEVGITATMLYDAIGRLYKTELPNGTHTRISFDAWREKKYDVNDTVGGTPWFTDRIGGTKGLKEQQAAEKAFVHNDTPSEIHFDTLGRSFYTIDHNRYTDRADPTNIVEEFYHSLVEMDVEGNHRRVVDARNAKRMNNGQPYVAVVEYAYDLAGNKIKQSGMDTGDRWTLNDCMGKALCGWDSKGNNFTSYYDALNRPSEHHVHLPADAVEGLPARTIVYDRAVFGTNTLADRNKNLNGKLFKQYDGAGEITHHIYDFRGNAKRTTRKFTIDHTTTPDWTNPAAIFLQPKSYTIQTEYDALDRAIRTTSADGSITRQVYNEAGLLNEVYIGVRGTAERQFINNIDHDAKGQRTSIEYSNHTKTVHQYDPLTYRLIRTTTRHQVNGKLFQDIVYTHDPTGNITSIQDLAQQTLYFNNSLINPHSDYKYDALYRLIQSDGREHTSMHRPPNESDSFRQQIPLPTDELAMQNYREHFEYDEVGNILRMIHHGGRGSMSLRWTKEFDYAIDSNQLTSTTVGGNTENYTYDVSGQMENLPHLNGLLWGFENSLDAVDKGGGGKVYYHYDAEGNRVRKVWVKPGNIVEERVYVGTVEIFTITQGGSDQLARETLHINDNKKRIALIETRTDSNPEEQLTRYQYGNHLGTAALELDHNGDVISYEEYYAFGSTSFQSGRSTAEVNLKRYRYTGKERDEESGLYYHGARYYAPWLARWTAADPAGLEDGPNLYIYVNNNPVNTHDPTGLWGWREVAVVAAVVVVGVAVTVVTAGAAGPVIAGFAAGALGAGTTAATVATGVAVGAVAGAAGGLASGVAGELTRQTVHSRALGLGEENFSASRVARAGAEGLVAGAVGGALTGGLGAAATVLRGGATAAATAGTAAQATRTAATATRAATTASRVATVAGRTARGAALGATGGVAGEAARQAVFEGRIDRDRLVTAAWTGGAVGAGLGALNIGGSPIRPSRAAYLRGIQVRSAVQSARSSITGRNYIITRHGNVAGREVVTVATPRGPRAFYSRTGGGGSNAGGAQPGDWAPFEGFSRGGYSQELGGILPEGWFIKHNFVTGRSSDPLYRFGTQENLDTSRWIGQQGLQQSPTPRPHTDVNPELQSAGIRINDPVRN